MFITPILAVIAAFTPVPDTTTGNALLATASGATSAPKEEVLNARLQICVAALQTGIGPDQLKTFVKSKGFTEEAAQSTVDDCVSFVVGYKTGNDAAKPTV